MRAESVDNEKLNIKDVMRIINNSIGMLNQYNAYFDTKGLLVSKKKCQKQIKDLYDVLIFLIDEKTKTNNTIINYFCCNPEEYPKPTINGDTQIYNYFKE